MTLESYEFRKMDTTAALHLFGGPNAAVWTAFRLKADNTSDEHHPGGPRITPRYAEACAYYNEKTSLFFTFYKVNNLPVV